MIKRLLKLKLWMKILSFVKKNKIVSMAFAIFIAFSGINLFLIYSFVQVLETI